jgi:hypothetical protein
MGVACYPGCPCALLGLVMTPSSFPNDPPEYLIPGVVQAPLPRPPVPTEEEVSQQHHEDHVRCERMRLAVEHDDIAAMHDILSQYRLTISEILAEATNMSLSDPMMGEIPLFGKPSAEAKANHARVGALKWAAGKNYSEIVSALVANVEMAPEILRKMLRRVAVSRYAETVQVLIPYCGLDSLDDPAWTQLDTVFFQALAESAGEHHMGVLEKLGQHWGLTAPALERWQVRQALLAQLDSAAEGGARMATRL